MKSKVEELVKKYNIDLKKLESEQNKLAKAIEIKDFRDFKDVEIVGGIDNTFFKNKIISAIVVMDVNGEVVGQQYFSDVLKFPYLPGFRAYRELPAMLEAFRKLDIKPEVMFVKGHGTAHPRLGLASHFALSAQIPCIGVADSLVVGEEKGGKIILNGKEVGVVLHTKEGSKPIYVSPGNLISLKSAADLTERFIKKPHKLPDPIVQAHKYGKKVRKEVFAD
ncbi:MAG: endonuclease V [archaeon]